MIVNFKPETEVSEAVFNVFSLGLEISMRPVPTVLEEVEEEALLLSG